MRWFLLPLVLLAGPALPAWADEGKAAGKTHQVPYKLTNTKHVLVRAKLNGKGPFNFIIDTGAPALFVSNAAARKAGIQKNDQGWAVVDRFEIEGGIVLEKEKGCVEDPYQLTGMNGLGLAGAELHGIIGYTILARFRTSFDFTKHKMEWTTLDFVPPAPVGLGDGAHLPEGFDVIVNMVEMLSQFMGRKAEPEVVPRGFLGIEVEEQDKSVVVKTILPKGPAARAGVQAGDRILELGGKAVPSMAELLNLVSQVPGKQSISLRIQRSGELQTIEIETGEGL